MEGKVSRRFWLQDGVIVRIDWGGAVSELRDSREAAEAGSAVETGPVTR